METLLLSQYANMAVPIHPYFFSNKGLSKGGLILPRQNSRIISVISSVTHNKICVLP